MKKKIILSLIGIILISGLLISLINKKDEKYIMQDGIKLALKLDGETITKFPDGTNYRVEVNCNNGKGIWLPDEWKLAVEDITEGVICNLDFFTRTDDDKLINVVEDNGTNYTGSNGENAGYRYSGKNPNNYILFNNELWRIIGSVPTCTTANCGTSGTNMVKIIRNASIGNIAYSVNANEHDGTGIWSQSTLNTLLNTYYYGATDGTNSNYCFSYTNTVRENCNYTKIGINPNNYYGKMVESVYWNSGNDNHEVTVKQAYTDELKVQTVKNPIGIMTVADYGYATGSTSKHDSVMSEFSYTTSVASTNWIYSQGNESILSNKSSYVLYIEDWVRINSTYPTTGFAVRPVVYLNKDIYVVSGDGSINYPYQITM